MAEVLFKKVDYPLKKLIEDISIGEIRLPDIQRPFVWPRAKVRDFSIRCIVGTPSDICFSGRTACRVTIGLSVLRESRRLHTFSSLTDSSASRHCMR
jgi:hypothetical protein